LLEVLELVELRLKQVQAHISQNLPRKWEEKKKEVKTTETKGKDENNL
jgi:hypothetical protein